ncbi:C-factor [Dactylellina cionopaga]|nr:C-factor [Dactylellina cionopaga]
MSANYRQSSGAQPDHRISNIAAIKTFVTEHHDTYPAISPLAADLTGKSVVITGASKGVGYATAISFAKSGCSKIAISARSSLDTLRDDILKAAREAGREPPLIVSMKVDVTSESEVSAFVTEVSSKFSNSVDVLINNAGYLETWAPFADTDPSEWWKSWEVNVKGLYLCSKYFLPLVLASPTKTVLNIASIGAVNIAYGASAYQSTKFAVCRLTEFMINDYWDQGLIAMSLHPGGVKTELALNMPESVHHVLIDEPELPADTMVWLAKERREWLNGRYVSVTWDVEELEAKKKDIVEKDMLKFRLVID